MKHREDEEWVNFSYEMVKREKEKGNEKRAKKSLLFRSPDKIQPSREEMDRGKKNDGYETSGPSTSSGLRNQYVPASRNQAAPDVSAGKESNRWRPPVRVEEEDDLME